MFQIFLSFNPTSIWKQERTAHFVFNAAWPRLKLSHTGSVYSCSSSVMHTVEKEKNQQQSNYKKKLKFRSTEKQEA